MYRDEIYNKLRDTSIRDRMLNKSFSQEECNDERVYRLLKLLHQNKECCKKNRKETAIED